MRATLLLALVPLTVQAACVQAVDTTGGQEQDEAPFAVPTDRITLLPLRVRHSKVAAVAGVATTDPMFDVLRASATQLGDHDFASGVPQNPQWGATRIALWMKAMEPVCASPAMHTRFPALPAGAADLIAAAYGRPATATDVAAVEEGLAALALDEAERYQMTCIAVLSSLELLSR